MRQGWSSVVALCLLVGTAHAQQSAEATRPEVQILVVPGPTGWMVATVYPGKVGHAQTQARLRRLRLLTGWPVENLTFEDRQLDRQTAAVANPKQASTTRPVMSSATFQTSGNVADYLQGTLVLEPFLIAFQDFNRVNVTYLGLTKFPFQGLSHYSDEHVEVSLAAQEGSYAYQVTLKDHAFKSLNLPLHDIAKQESPPEAVNTTSPSRRLTWGIAVVALMAVGVAGIAYAVAHRFSHRQ